MKNKNKHQNSMNPLLALIKGYIYTYKFLSVYIYNTHTQHRIKKLKLVKYP